jgi:hypothetical protein
MNHHTASYPSQGNTPCLFICKHGRSDLVGPLCNGYMGYDRIYRIITMGLANHPGAGGPFTADGVTLPKDSARIGSWGTEFEGGYLDWTADMMEAMGLADVALARWMKRPVTSQLEHSTWTPRKSDRRHMSRADGIALSRKYWNVGAGTPAPVPGVPDLDPMTISEWCVNRLANDRGGVSGTCRVDCDRVIGFAAALDPRLQAATVPAYLAACKAGNWNRAGELLEYAVRIIQSRGHLTQDGVFGDKTGQFMAAYGYTVKEK